MSHLDEGRLHALLDGELSDAERSQAEEHLAACPECRQSLAEARTLFQEADALVAAVDLPPSTAPRPAAAPLRRGGGFRWQRVAWAATVVLAVGLGWLAKSDQVKRTASETDVAAAPASLQAAGPDSTRPAEEAPQGSAAEGKTLGMTRNRPEPVAPRTLDKVAAKGEREVPVQPIAPAAEPAPAPSPGAAPTVAQAERAEAGRGNEAGAIAPTPLDVPHEKALADAVQPQRARTDAAALESRRAAQAPSAAALARDESLRGIAPTASRSGGSLRPILMEEAVRILGGSIRLVDGMTPLRILAGEANPAGAEPPYTVVRVVYDDPPGRELWLDQQRPVEAAADRVVSGPVGLLPGDTVVSLVNRGARSLRWLDQAGFRLGLTGFLPADSLRALVRRVR